MIRIDLKDKLLYNPDGTPVMQTPTGKKEPVAEQLADDLARILNFPHNKDSVKTWEMSCKITRERVLEVDTSDCKMIEEIIEENKEFFPLVKGQLLLEIRKAKLEAVTKEKEGK